MTPACRRARDTFAKAPIARESSDVDPADRAQAVPLKKADKDRMYSARCAYPLSRLLTGSERLPKTFAEGL